MGKIKFSLYSAIISSFVILCNVDAFPSASENGPPEKGFIEPEFFNGDFGDSPVIPLKRTEEDEAPHEYIHQPQDLYKPGEYPDYPEETQDNAESPIETNHEPEESAHYHETVSKMPMEGGEAQEYANNAEGSPDEVETPPDETNYQAEPQEMPEGTLDNAENLPEEIQDTFDEPTGSPDEPLETHYNVEEPQESHNVETPADEPGDESLFKAETPLDEPQEAFDKADEVITYNEAENLPNDDEETSDKHLEAQEYLNEPKESPDEAEEPQETLDEPDGSPDDVESPQNYNGEPEETSNGGQYNAETAPDEPEEILDGSPNDDE